MKLGMLCFFYICGRPGDFLKGNDGGGGGAEEEGGETVDGMQYMRE